MLGTRGIGAGAAALIEAALTPRHTGGLAAALLYGEQSSARLANLASRAMTDPGSLTLAEIRSLGGSVLTQAPDKK